MSTNHPLFSKPFVICFFQPVSGVINKDCTEAEYLYSSQCECLSEDTVLQSCEGTGASKLTPHHQPLHYITA